MNRVILLLLAAGMAAVLWLSPRSWSMTDTPRIETIAALPESDAVEAALASADSAIVLPYLPGEARARSAAARSAPPALRLGMLYREVSIMKMPLWAYRDGGLVAYRELPEGYSAEPVPAEQVAALEAAAGRTYSGQPFPLWTHMWGWLFAAGFILWWFVARFEEARRDPEQEPLGGEPEPA
ncbi:MAG: hypothetical protein QOH81_3138 [Sphingomonadales bacterium]|jgi:hypothetical protein|nr:hypothetical protein [Sphingomonadales bacterium]